VGHTMWGTGRGIAPLTSVSSRSSSLTASNHARPCSTTTSTSASLDPWTLSNPTVNPIPHTQYALGAIPHYRGQQTTTMRLAPAALRSHAPCVHNHNDAAIKDAVYPPSNRHATFTIHLTPSHLPLARMPTALSLWLERLRLPSQPANPAPKMPPASPTTTSSHPTLPSDPARHHGQSKIQSKIAINITLAHTPRLAPLRSDDPRLGQLYQPLPQYYLSQTPVLHHGLSSLATTTTEMPNVASRLSFKGSRRIFFFVLHIYPSDTPSAIIITTLALFFFCFWIFLCEGTHRNAHSTFLSFLEGGTCGCATSGISHFGPFSDSLR